MWSQVDLVLVFKGTVSKQQASQNAHSAELEYNRLIKTLTDAGLKATARRGGRQGQLLVLIWTPPHKVAQLLEKQSRVDFLLGLPSTSVHIRDFGASPLSHADRLRLVHSYVTSLVSEGGLGITTGVHHWPRVESILALHDHDFNHALITSWTRRRVGFDIGFAELNKIRDQFGEAVALYFAFLSCYTLALTFPAAVGIIFWFFSSSYSPWYSAILCLWSICWVEWWRVREKMLSVRWGTLGSFRAEKKRPEFRGPNGESAESTSDHAFPWWKRELRMLGSLPIILFFAAILAALLTVIFIIEAFVTEFYQGPLQEYISLAPTILFAALVPRVLALYKTFASRMTSWENHPHQSSHDGSLTIKTFALSAIVSYMGLALLAFIYVPFGEVAMSVIQEYIILKTQSGDGTPGKSFFALKAQNQIDHSRLQKQMFAITVTSQISNTLEEVILPYVMRAINNMRIGKVVDGLRGKKMAASEHEKGDAEEEAQLLKEIRHNVTLSEYSLFGDYDEMITQFGYVALWSTIWPLTPVMALVNNWFEMRSDAFKIVTHHRRPLPVRVDTIGPWLDAMTSISWLGAITNSALVYLFRPQDGRTSPPGLGEASELKGLLGLSAVWHSLMVPALLIAFSSSHAYLLLRSIVQHAMVRAFWRGSEEEHMLEQTRDEINNFYLSKAHQEVSETTVAQFSRPPKGEEGQRISWHLDEGVEELRQATKTA